MLIRNSETVQVDQRTAGCFDAYCDYNIVSIEDRDGYMKIVFDSGATTAFQILTVSIRRWEQGYLRTTFPRNGALVKAKCKKLAHVELMIRAAKILDTLAVIDRANPSRMEPTVNSALAGISKAKGTSHNSKIAFYKIEQWCKQWEQYIELNGPTRMSQS